MNKLDYLRELCKSAQLILLDTNILSSHNIHDKEPISQQLYDCHQSLDIDQSRLADEIQARNALNNLIRNNKNVRITQGVLDEESVLCKIINSSVVFHEKRKYNHHKATGYKARDGHTYRSTQTLEEDEDEDETRGLLRNYADSIFETLEIVRDRVIQPSDCFNGFLKTLINLSEKYALKKKSMIYPYSSNGHNRNDEGLVALSFSHAYHYPVNLMSTDTDIFRLCTSLAKELQRTSSIYSTPTNPVHLHTIPRSNEQTIEHRVSYLILRR